MATKVRKWHVVVYQDLKFEWRWSLRAGNGERIADSAEGYKSVTKCKNMVKKIAKLFATAVVEIEKRF